MPDILIRGYSMPNGCGVCPLNTGAFYCAGLKRYVIEEEHVWMGSNYRRLKDCPLHELPEHGDLIDRNETLKAMEWTWAGKAAFEAVENVRTIVPAEREETE